MVDISIFLSIIVGGSSRRTEFFVEQLVQANRIADEESNMSSSELRYLIAANELAEQMEVVKQTDVANKLNVSKVSTHNAIERLRDKGFIEKNDT
jgi:DNA-binding MarR family transcriptional regulator